MQSALQAASFSMTRSVISTGVRMTASVDRWTAKSPRTHKSRRSSRCMMRIGKNESPVATQRTQLAGHLFQSAESEDDARRQCRVLEGLHAVFVQGSCAYFRRGGELLGHRLTHRKLLDLAGYGGGEAFYEPDVARDLVVRDPIL